MTILPRMRALGVAAYLGLWTAGAGAQLLQPAGVQPDALMRAVTAEVAEIFKEDRAVGHRTDVAPLIASRILPHFDFARMTRMAVARNWRLASPEQQAKLVEEFRQLLVRTYSGVLSDYRGQPLEFRPLRAAPGDTEVQVRSFMRQPGAEPLTIDYDMQNGEAGWSLSERNRQNAAVAGAKLAPVLMLYSIGARAKEAPAQ
jgi:phospholipid transport system substrate-binding protein